MQLITQLPALSMTAPGSVVVHAVQDDSLARWYSAPLVAGGSPWTPPAGASAAIFYRRGDGAPGTYDVMDDEDATPAVSWSGSTVTFGLCDHALAAAGRGELSLVFLCPDGDLTERLAAFRMILDVEPTPYPSEEIITSDPYVNILSQQIAAVLEAAADLTGITASATEGASASVTVTGGSGGQPYNLAFVIPRGNTGPAPDFSIGTVSTLSAGSPATVTLTGTDEEPVLNFGIPKGADGSGAVSTVMGVSPDAGTHDVAKADLLNLIYPVGFYLWTSVAPANFDPNTAFGGTWERVKDKVVLAAGDDYTAGDTGGSATATVDFSNGFADIGWNDKSGDPHYDGLYLMVDTAKDFTALHRLTASNAAIGWADSQSPHSVDELYPTKLEGTQTIQTMMPYVVAYCWHRTA